MGRDVDLIKEKLDIVEFIKSYVKLSPAGRNLKGLCPFHQEKTPSFVVSPERQVWHCFGCGGGGDLITFVMQYENLEFLEALRFLAEKAGIPLKEVSPREQRELTRLYDINDLAKRFFVGELQKNKDAHDYLRGRGLNNETIEVFGLGFAPGGDSLVKHLLLEGHRVDDVVQAGLAYKYQGLYKDKFGSRITFPIANNFGKIVAFTGRIFPEDREGDKVPKYVNSPETPIFSKSKVLYGLDKTKPEIVREREVFVVEGQMDLLVVWQSGTKNIVAVSGTALTVQHLTTLRRLADTVVVSFDNDESGLRALERSLLTFGNFDFHVKVVDLGKFKDPAEACLEDPEFFREAVTKARPVLKHLFEHYLRKEKVQTISDRKEAIRHLLGKIKGLKSVVEQDIWIAELADYSGVSEPSLKTELERVDAPMDTQAIADDNKKIDQVPGRSDRVNTIATRALTIAFTSDDFWNIVETNKAWFPEAHRAVIDNPKDAKASSLDLEASHIVGSIDNEKLHSELNDLIRQLKIGGLKQKQKEIREKMQRSSQNEAELSALASEFQSVARQIDELKT